MPNFDGGHYFLTALIPVRTDAMPKTALEDDPVWKGYELPVSHADHLRGTLATLPAAQQTPPWVKIGRETGLNSPFARNARTHLTRFVVIEDPMYNGRLPQDAIVTAVTGANPTEPEPVDSLTCPFLLWAVEFDPIDTDKPDPREPEHYLRELWEQMEPELRAVFTHCVGFDDGVSDARGFAAYIRRCQIETTMPFNDYWIVPPPIPSMSGTLKLIAVPAVVAGLAFVLGFLAWIASGMFGFGPLLGLDTGQWATVALSGLAALVVTVLFAYWLVMRNGGKPFPTAPNSDLRSVLKAIYLQQRFTAFAIENQGADAETLHRAFGTFIAEHRPDDRDRPTQPPGVIRTPPHVPNPPHAAVQKPATMET